MIEMLLNMRLSQREEQEIAQLPIEEIVQIRKLRFVQRFMIYFDRLYRIYKNSNSLYNNHITIRIDKEPKLILLTNSEFVGEINNYLKDRCDDPKEIKKRNRLLKSIFGEKYTPEIIVKNVEVKTYHYGKGYKVVDIKYDNLY